MARTMLLLATVAFAALAACAEATWFKVGPIRPRPLPDCCPVGQFCCTGGCISEKLRPTTFCGGGGTCCGTDPDPQPDPEPADGCTAKAPICCGSRCITLEEAAVTLCPIDSDCTGPPPPPRGDCCGFNQYCCGNRCASSNPRTNVFCLPVAGGCCGPPDEEDIKRCCAVEGRVCCDGECFPPGTNFLRECESDSCGCPEEEEEEPAPPEEVCCGDGQCCDGLTCCGGDCIPGPLPKDTACLALACCTDGSVVA